MFNFRGVQISGAFHLSGCSKSGDKCRCIQCCVGGGIPRESLGKRDASQVVFTAS